MNSSAPTQDEAGSAASSNAAPQIDSSSLPCADLDEQGRQICASIDATADRILLLDLVIAEYNHQSDAFDRIMDARRAAVQRLTTALDHTRRATYVTAMLDAVDGPITVDHKENLNYLKPFAGASEALRESARIRAQAMVAPVIAHQHREWRLSVHMLLRDHFQVRERYNDAVERRVQRDDAKNDEITRHLDEIQEQVWAEEHRRQMEQRLGLRALWLPRWDWPCFSTRKLTSLV